jgi:hypothetical protein
MPSIRKMAESFAADRKFTRDEAQALVNKVKENGVVSRSEKLELRKIVAKYKDLFDPAAFETLKPLIGTVVTPPPPPSTGVTNLDPSGTHRPVFLGANGVFSTTVDGAPPRTNADLGDAIFRAAELVDDAPGNVFLDARVSKETRSAAFDQVAAALAKVPAGRPPPDGLDANQALQLRSSAATVLLHLLEASPEPELSGKMLAAYEGLAKGETDRRLRESMVFHLSNSAPAQRPGPVKEASEQLMETLAPMNPPYDKWFANGNKKVDLSWTVGQGEFWKPFTDGLKAKGFKAVGVENQYGATTYEKTFNKPGVGETTFRVSVREGGTNLLAPVADGESEIIGYDGHSNWGRNMTSSVRNGPASPDGGDGRLFVYNLCVGKGVLDRLKEKYPNLQAATTFGASYKDTDIDDLCDSIASREGWERIHERMNETSGPRGNIVTPVSTLVRERVLDRDNDGQSDYLDKHMNFNTFRVPEDTAREFAPIRQPRPANVLDGTKVLVSGQMLNTVSEFSAILDRVNPDSKVVTDGYFEPREGEREIIKFSQARGPDGKPEIRMKVNAAYSHMSEEAMRAVTTYEFNRYLGKTGQLRLDPIDAKIAGMISFAQSMQIDEGYRDREVWGAFLKRYNLPDVGLSAINSQLDAEHHDYAGTPEMVRAIRAQLTPEMLHGLQRPEAGEPGPV